MQPVFPLQEILAALINQLGEQYVFPERVPDIAASLRQRLKEGSYDTGGDGDLLAQRITEDLRAVGHDQHLRLIYQADGVSPQIDDHELYTAAAIEHMRQQRSQNYGLKKVEILEGNIGYLHLTTFVHPHVAGESMRAAMAFLTHTQALIIDLRANGGGEGLMAQFLCSYFFDAFAAESIQLNGLYDRRTDRVYQYWVFPYVPGERYLGKPLYLLTSHRTFSAAEEFTYDLQQLKRALVVGETTRGGAHTALRYPIHPHFEAVIPNRRAINPVSGTNWEGVGVQPDLPVAQEEALDVAYQRALAETQH